MMDLLIILGEIVKKFKNINNLEVKYFNQKNQGKMQAINNLIEHATGELVMDCDSDDYFIRSSFEKIYKYSEKLLNNNLLYGLAFLKNENKNKISGNIFIEENKETTMFDLYFKDGIIGEKVIVFNTKIRKMFKHELEDDEKFITEARMYHKMDLNYKIKCYNEVIIEGEYLENGYTNNILKTFFNNPKGYYYYFRQILQHNMKGVIFKKRIYAIKHYILFEYLLNKKMTVSNIKDILNKHLYIFLYIPGRIKSKIKIKKDGKHEYIKK